MKQEVLNSELISLERKVKLLLGEFSTMRNEIMFLKKENADLSQRLQQKDEQINNFQNQIKISKIVNSIEAEGTEASGLKAKINEYIKEIDKCILHLSQ